MMWSHLLTNSESSLAGQMFASYLQLSRKSKEADCNWLNPLDNLEDLVQPVQPGSPYHLLLQMRGMEISLRGGLMKGKHSGAGSSKSLDNCRTSKRAQSHMRASKYRDPRCINGLLCFIACFFIIMLKPDWLLPFNSHYQLPRPSVLQVGNTSLAGNLVHTDLSELKKESYHPLHREAPDILQNESSNFAVMEQRLSSSLQLSHHLKVFVYDLPSSFNVDWLKDDRCSSHLFASEVAIHQRLLRSPVRTMQPADADFYFVPVYVSCNFSTRTGFPSVGHASSILKSATKLISHAMPYWNQSGGRDHIFVASHDYGPCFRTMEDLAIGAGIPKFLENSIILQTFGRVDGHICQAKHHIQIPPYVSPFFLKPGWCPDQQRRDIWAYFRGKMEVHPKNESGRVYSRGIRTTIWQKFRRDGRFFIKRKRSVDYLSEIQRSVFCLCPLGWAPWSPRLVEAVMFGCVPVIIADRISLPYPHVIDWAKISVSIAEKDVNKLAKILERVSCTNLKNIQKNLWREANRRALLYLDPLTRGDATWQILEVLARNASNFRATLSSA